MERFPLRHLSEAWFKGWLLPAASLGGGLTAPSPLAESSASAGAQFWSARSYRGWEAEAEDILRSAQGSESTSGWLALREQGESVSTARYRPAGSPVAD